MLNCWLKVFWLKNGCVLLTSDPLGLDTASLWGNAGHHTFTAAKGVGPRLATGRKEPGKECHLEQAWGCSQFHVRCRWKGKCCSGKHRTLETMHMEGEQNPEDYIRVKSTPTNQNISPGDGIQRRNVWQTNHSVFLKQERKEGRKGERKKKGRKEVKKEGGKEEEKRRKEKKKKSPYCVSSLYQPKALCHILLSVVGIIKTQAYKKIHYEYHLLLHASIFFSVGNLTLIFREEKSRHFWGVMLLT